jgi:hypothetical protein
VNIERTSKAGQLFPPQTLLTPYVAHRRQRTSANMTSPSESAATLLETVTEVQLPCHVLRVHAYAADKPTNDVTVPDHTQFYLGLGHRSSRLPNKTTSHTKTMMLPIDECEQDQCDHQARGPTTKNGAPSFRFFCPRFEDSRGSPQKRHIRKATYSRFDPTRFSGRRLKLRPHAHSIQAVHDCAWVVVHGVATQARQHAAHKDHIKRVRDRLMASTQYSAACAKPVPVAQVLLPVTCRVLITLTHIRQLLSFSQNDLEIRAQLVTNVKYIAFAGCSPVAAARQPIYDHVINPAETSQL